MSEAIKALSTDHATQGIMERIRGSVQSLDCMQVILELALADVCAGRAFTICISKLTDTHLSLGVDEENNLFINFYIRLRLPQVGGGHAGGGRRTVTVVCVGQLVGGFKSNWAR
eukprot:753267-Hanusia_phi.AAC.1